MSGERLKKVQKGMMYLLYAAMALKVIGDFVPVLAFVSAVLVTLFFIVELFVLDFKQLILISTVVGVLFYWLPAMVGLILGMLTASVALQFIAGVICYACSTVTFTFVWGVLTSVSAVSLTAPLTVTTAVTGAVVATGMAIGAGVYATVNEIGQTVSRHKRHFVLALLGNVLAFVLICWPILSYTMAITGALACKPAVLLNQAHFHHLNLKASETYEALFSDEDQWVFTNQFYHDILRGSNNNITQGKRDLIAGNGEMLAVLLNGAVHIYTDDMTEKIETSAYFPRRTDAMVIADGKVFIFGKNKVFVCGAQGEYTWKKTDYTSDFTKLPWEAQCERVYDILERQNTDVATRFSYDDVGTVAYAQRNGLLLNYNRLTHTAWFVREENGSVTVWEQSATDERREVTSFTPNESKSGQPWVAVGADGVLYAAQDRIEFLAAADGFAAYQTFANPDGDGFCSVHYGWAGDSDNVYSVYADEDTVWVDTRNVGTASVTPVTLASRAAVAGFAGQYFYSVQYEDNWLAKLTYIYDVRPETNPLTTVWFETFDLQRIKLDPAVLG